MISCALPPCTMSSLWSGAGVGILLRRSTADGATHLKQYYTLDIAVPKALSDLLDKIKTSTSPTASKGPTHDGEDVDTGNAAGKGSATPYQLPALLDIARLVLTPSGAGGIRAGTTPPKARSRALALDCLRLGLVLHLAPSEGDRLKDFRREALAVAAAGAKDERWEVRVAAARTAGEVLRRTGGHEKLIHLLSSEQVRERESLGTLCFFLCRGRMFVLLPTSSKKISSSCRPTNTLGLYGGGCLNLLTRFLVFDCRWQSLERPPSATST